MLCLVRCFLGAVRGLALWGRRNDLGVVHMWILVVFLPELWEVAVNFTFKPNGYRYPRSWQMTVAGIEVRLELD